MRVSSVICGENRDRDVSTVVLGSSPGYVLDTETLALVLLLIVLLVVTKA